MSAFHHRIIVGRTGVLEIRDGRVFLHPRSRPCMVEIGKPERDREIVIVPKEDPIPRETPTPVTPPAPSEAPELVPA